MKEQSQANVQRRKGEPVRSPLALSLSSRSEPESVASENSVNQEVSSLEPFSEPSIGNLNTPGFSFGQIPLHAPAPLISQIPQATSQTDQHANEDGQEDIASSVAQAASHSTGNDKRSHPQKKHFQGAENTENLPPVVTEVLQSSGQPLNETARSSMQPRFGYDFSKIRVHTDERAATSAYTMHALAYTVGTDLVFAPGQYQPETAKGQRLLAHELTHVVQQTQGQHTAETSQPVQYSSLVSQPGDPLEQEAEAVAEQIVNPDTPLHLPAISSATTQIARTGDTQVAEPQTADTSVVLQAADIILKALKGITTRGDSADILAQFQGKNATTVRAILQELKNRAGQYDQTSDGMIDWLFGDMTAEDRRDLRKLLISVGVVEDLAHIVASLVKKDLGGLYTSESDSQEILQSLGEFSGSGLDTVLSQLETLANKNSDDMANQLLDAMDRTNAEHLRQLFFQVGATRATRYACVYTTTRIMSLLAGYTSHADSSAIVWNMDTTPSIYRPIVMGLLNGQTQAKRSQSAEDALMEDMDRSDYEQLRTMAGVTLRAYDRQPGLLERAISGAEWAEIAVEVLAGGIIGVVTGILTALYDIVHVVVDIVVAAYNLVMSFLYLISAGAIGSEEWLAVKDFFKGMGQAISDPEAVLRQAWEETRLESATIQGPFAYGRKAEFWVRKTINAVVNILLIAAAGYGLVKGAVSAAVEVGEVVAKEGGVIKAMGALARRALRASGKLLAVPAEQAGRLLEALRSPLQTLRTLGQRLNVIRMAVQDEGLWAYLRGRTGTLAENERRWWKEQGQRWDERAKLKQQEVDGLTDEADQLSADLNQNQAPQSPEENVTGVKDDVEQLDQDVNQLENEVKGPEQEPGTQTSEEPAQPSQQGEEVLPKPTPEQYARIDEYVQALSELRDAMLAKDEAAIARANATLDKIEQLAFGKGNEQLLQHLETLIDQRSALRTGKMVFPYEDPPGSGKWVEGLGRRFDCQSAQFGPFRGKTYTEVEGILGRPTVIEGSPPGRVRLTWRFADDSFIHVDVPGSGNESPFELSQQPHLARTASAPYEKLHLSDSGVGVPTNSTPAHIEIGDDALLQKRINGGGN